MYGMINKALGEMICQRFGEEAWQQVKRKANCDVRLFLTNESYPDKVTYELVGAASTVLGLPASELMEAFGEHWVLQTAEEGFRTLMQAGGESLREFLGNLPDFHARIKLVFPNLTPPRFICEPISDCSMRVHHLTGRPGLAPFVKGLLQGLGKRFQITTVVDLVKSREAGSEHDVFEVHWTPVGQP